jgi:hypothetical protein
LQKPSDKGGHLLFAPEEELVVANNLEDLLQMYRLTRDRRVPVCAWGDCVVVGFDLAALKKLLA